MQRDWPLAPSTRGSSGSATDDGRRLDGRNLSRSAAAEPSQVFVSQTVKDLAAGSGFAFEPAGDQQVKRIPETWRLYAAI